MEVQQNLPEVNAYQNEIRKLYSRHEKCEQCFVRLSGKGGIV